MKIPTPDTIQKATKEDLVVTWEQSTHLIDELTGALKAIKDELYARMKNDGEIIGDHSVVKAKRMNFKVKLDQAKELGAIKMAVDNKALKELHNKGIDIPHTVTEYLIIRPVEK